MSTETPTIPAETARHVLWTFAQDGGYRPGTFTQKLLELLAYADVQNTAKLAVAYPAEAEAVRLAKYENDGIDRLKAIAESEQASIRCADCGGVDGPFGERVEGYVCEGCMRKRAN